jgi:uncharacterized protein YdhG (YjbR/CyaY superfamily)
MGVPLRVWRRLLGAAHQKWQVNTPPGTPTLFASPMNREMVQGKERPKNVSEYIKAAPKDARMQLREIRSCLRKAAPGAKESLKWGVPALAHKRILFMYAAFKNHISLFPTPKAVRAFAASLTDFRTSSSTIQFPLDRPLPLRLIRKIALFRVQDSQENDARWM